MRKLLFSVSVVLITVCCGCLCLCLCFIMGFIPTARNPLHIVLVACYLCNSAYRMISVKLGHFLVNNLGGTLTKKTMYGNYLCSYN